MSKTSLISLRLKLFLLTIRDKPGLRKQWIILRLSWLRSIPAAFMCVLLWANAPAWAAEEWLTLKLKGVDETMEQNILAHLGSLPKSDMQRRAFLFNAQERVTAALQSMGYYHGQIEEKLREKDKGPWKLTLNILPGEPIRLQWVDIRFSGEMLEDETFDLWLSTLEVKPGDILNHGVYENIKSQLVALALDRGYFEGEFTLAQIKINRDLKRAQLNLHFHSGPRYRLGQVSFEGHSLDDTLMEKLIPFEVDEYYATKRLAMLNRQLYDTGYFSNIKVLPQIDRATDRQLPVKVELSPKPDHSIDLGLGADIGNSTENTYEPRIRVTWRTPQVNHYGHSQETSLEWSPERPKFLTTYSIPLTDPLKDKLKLRLGLLRDTYGATQVYDADSREFSTTGQLESSKQLIGVLRQQMLDSQWLMSYSVEANRETYTQSEIDYDPILFMAGLSLSHTQRGDTSLDPKSGFRQNYNLEYAEPYLGSSVRLARLQSKFKWIETLFDKHRFVSRLDLGLNYAKGDDLAKVPPSLRYFAGGDQSIRGYGYQELGPYLDYTNSQGQLVRQVVGGRYLAIASVEYQYYVTPTWRVATFVDGGNAFDVDRFEAVYSTGVGLHWISPIGPIKLDVGVGLKDTDTVMRSWRIHLTMGSEL
jgi:translocation and assembly module TamA